MAAEGLPVLAENFSVTLVPVGNSKITPELFSSGKVGKKIGAFELVIIIPKMIIDMVIIMVTIMVIISLVFFLVLRPAMGVAS